VRLPSDREEPVDPGVDSPAAHMPAGEALSDTSPRRERRVLDEPLLSADHGGIEPVAQEPPRAKVEDADQTCAEPGEPGVRFVLAFDAHDLLRTLGARAIVLMQQEELQSVVPAPVLRGLSDQAADVIVFRGHMVAVGAVRPELARKGQRNLQTLCLVRNAHGIKLLVPPPAAIVFEVEPS
jgi:hypothetical protein